jgi:hypothetical protein
LLRSIPDAGPSEKALNVRPSNGGGRGQDPK